MRSECQLDGGNAFVQAFAQSDDRGVVLLEELINPLLLRFANVRRIGVGVEIVRADLKADQTQGVEGALDQRLRGRNPIHTPSL